MNLIPTDRESAQRWALHWIAAWNAHDIEAVLPYAQREAIVRGYAQKAGFAREQVRAA